MSCFGTYARVSTDEQAQHGTSLEVQVERCRSLALQLGAAEVRSFVDAGISGTDLSRPGLRELLEAAESGAVEAIVCLDPDRLARNLSHQLIITDRLEAIGVPLHFVQFEHRPTPDGRLLYAIRGAIAEFEAHKIRERTRQGKEQRLREGKAVTGTRILGYAYDAGRRRFVVDVAEAAVVQAVFAMAPQMSTHRIAASLNAAGLRAKGGGAFSQSAVQGMLRNPTYLGRMPQLRGLGSIAVPPLVSAEAFDRAADALSSRRRRPEGHGRIYLLTGVARCALCGRAVTGCGGSRPYYACAGKRSRPPCPAPYQPAQQLEAAVWRAVEQALRRAAALDPPERAGPNPAVERERRRSERRRRHLAQAAASGRIGPEDLALALEQIEARLRALDMAVPDGTGDAPEAARLLDGLDARLRRDVLRGLGVEVLVGPAGVEIRASDAKPALPSDR